MNGSEPGLEPVVLPTLQVYRDPRVWRPAPESGWRAATSQRGEAGRIGFGVDTTGEEWRAERLPDLSRSAFQLGDPVPAMQLRIELGPPPE